MLLQSKCSAFLFIFVPETEANVKDKLDCLLRRRPLRLRAATGFTVIKRSQVTYWRLVSQSNI